ncbi:endonuclease VIII [Marinobacter flavimaris]|uniref:DNA-(apurinic or apyrimidinic site) lyase n=2 Tax=Marinobacter TaxID=2742 RepID=A0A3D8H3J6_9GAMM|nr:endonuclease VIII [Marinobacter flavimaris]MBI45904.1 endonuclease VIII [Marinobacter sp.]PPI81029.1 endonuclease VIII [Marinobacter flavimaris]RDU41293.1 endonuclease VIII [Marinobacter flavimaris]
MPEGPEIRRMVDDIHKAVGGKTAQSVFFAFEHLKPFESALRGRRVERVEARSKAVLVFFEATDEDGPWCVYSHNQLYGKWRMGTPDREPSTNRQLRFAIIGPKKAARLYSASDIQLVRPDQLSEVPYLSRLGPDPLNQDVSVDQLLAVFDDKRFRGRNLGGLLLDQAFVAGIGNYLRSEILFEAGVSPRARPRDLDADQQSKLAEAILTLVQRTYRLKGITNPPERAERLKKEGWTFGQRRHMVFNRDGQRCHDCASPLVKTMMASRRLYYCPACQGTPA